MPIFENQFTVVAVKSQKNCAKRTGTRQDCRVAETRRFFGDRDDLIAGLAQRVYRAQRDVLVSEKNLSLTPAETIHPA